MTTAAIIYGVCAVTVIAAALIALFKASHEEPGCPICGARLREGARVGNATVLCCDNGHRGWRVPPNRKG